MTLKELRESVPMNYSELGKAAGLDGQTIRNAEAGQRVNTSTARAIAEALSKALNRQIRVQDIDGLKVRF